jgi:O-antigen/teichoic acid export membrane protein
MDKIMLGEFSGELEVGYYESAEKVIQIPNALINALGTVMLPYMSSLYSGNNFDRISANQIIRKSEHFMMLISSLIGFGIMAIATEFVPIFLGIEYDKCVILLYVLLPSCIFISFANVIRTQYLIPNKYDKEFTISLFIGAVINFVSNSILIPQHQSVGAAVGTLVAETAVCIAQMYFVRNKISIVKIFFECIGYVIIAVIMFAIGLIMPINLNNLVIRMLVKILICGLLWIISMTAYIVVINKKFEGFGIWFNIVKKKIK